MIGGVEKRIGGVKRRNDGRVAELEGVLVAFDGLLKGCVGVGQKRKSEGWSVHCWGRDGGVG